MSSGGYFRLSPAWRGLPPPPTTIPSGKQPALPCSGRSWAWPGATDGMGRQWAAWGQAWPWPSPPRACSIRQRSRSKWSWRSLSPAPCWWAREGKRFGPKPGPSVPDLLAVLLNPDRALRGGIAVARSKHHACGAIRLRGHDDGHGSVLVNLLRSHRRGVVGHRDPTRCIHADRKIQDGRGVSVGNGAAD